MKIDTNKSGSTVGRWVQKALYSSAVVGFAMTMGATSAVAGDNIGGNNFQQFTPVSRIAEMDVVYEDDGITIDYKKSYDKAREASVYLADYVARLKESDQGIVDENGENIIEGIDWKLGGTSKTCIDDRVCTNREIDEAVLMIPSPEPIDPNDPAYLEDGTVTKANTKKANVLDFCNGKYASLAMGVTPITGSAADGTGKYIVNGYSHAPALPCEVSIWFDKDKIYADMLDPAAIFTLFFTDALFSKEMDDRDFAKALYEMPPQVKKEIKAIIQTALGEFELAYAAEHGGRGEIDKMDQMIGPVYKNMGDIVSVVATSTYQSPYKHVSYTKENGTPFTETESKAVAQTIINTLSTHEDGADVGKHPTIINSDGDTLDSILSPKSSWRSARIAPISIPGKNHIIEACSPKYAKMAMSTGLSHVNALPCEITVKIIDRDGDPGAETLVVSYLDPDFMLKSLFADISNEDKKQFGDIPETIMTDLQNIVKAALEVNSGDALSGAVLNPGVQISYDMLPGRK